MKLSLMASAESFERGAGVFCSLSTKHPSNWRACRIVQKGYVLFSEVCEGGLCFGRACRIARKRGMGFAEVCERGLCFGQAFGNTLTFLWLQRAAGTEES